MGEDPYWLKLGKDLEIIKTEEFIPADIHRSFTPDNQKGARMGHHPGLQVDYDWSRLA